MTAHKPTLRKSSRPDTTAGRGLHARHCEFAGGGMCYRLECAVGDAIRDVENETRLALINEAASIAGTHPIQRVDIVSIESLRAIAEEHRP